MIDEIDGDDTPSVPGSNVEPLGAELRDRTAIAIDLNVKGDGSTVDRKLGCWRATTGAMHNPIATAAGSIARTHLTSYRLASAWHRMCSGISAWESSEEDMASLDSSVFPAATRAPC